MSLSRLKKAARLTWHLEYGGNYNAMNRSAQTLKEMNLTEHEEVQVLEIFEWMEIMMMKKGYWF